MCYLTSEARSLTHIPRQSWCWLAAFLPGGSKKQPFLCLFQLQGLAVFLGSFHLQASKGRLNALHADLHISLALPLYFCWTYPRYSRQFPYHKATLLATLMPFWACEVAHFHGTEVGTLGTCWSILYSLSLFVKAHH